MTDDVNHRARVFLDSIRHDPFLLDFARKARTTTLLDGGLSEPEDVLGEQASVALNLAYHTVRAAPYPGWHDLEDGRDADMLTTAMIVYQATPYLWLDKIQNLVGAQVMPRHIFMPESVPMPMWWAFEHDAFIGKEDTVGVGVVWYPSGDGAKSVLIGKTAQGYVTEWELNFKRRFRFPEDCPTPGVEVTQQALAMLSFLNSPYIPKAQRQISPKLRKSLGRKLKDLRPLDRMVHFVDLRAPLSQHREKKDTVPGTVEYRHRWLVRGHHRAQWYPSIDAHKVIWIAPYIKGPEDAPLSAPAYRVSR